MRIVVFGATGRTGVHVVEQALAKGHKVVAFVRNPSKLTIKHDNLQVVQGELTGSTQLAQAMAGADAVISVLGPTSNAPDYAVSKGMSNILDAMRQQKVRRLVIAAGAGVGDPNDAPKLFNHVISALLKLTARNVYEDMRRTVELVRGSTLDWTVVRVPMLTDGHKTGHIQVGYVGKSMGPRITRTDMADFIVQQVTDTAYIHKAPAISN